MVTAKLPSLVLGTLGAAGLGICCYLGAETKTTLRNYASSAVMGSFRLAGEIRKRTLTAC